MRLLALLIVSLCAATAEQDDAALFARAKTQMEEIRPLADGLRALQGGYPRVSSVEEIAPRRQELRTRLETLAEDLRARKQTLLAISRRQLYLSSIRAVGKAKTGRGPTTDQSLASYVDFHAAEGKVNVFLKDVEGLLERDEADYAALLARLEADRQRRLVGKLGTGTLAALAVGLCLWGLKGGRRMACLLLFLACPARSTPADDDRALQEDTMARIEEFRPFAEELRTLQRGYPRYPSLDYVGPRRAELRSRMEERIGALRARMRVLRDIRQRQIYVSSARIMGKARTGRGQPTDRSVDTLRDADAAVEKVDSFLGEMKALLSRDDADYQAMLARLEADRQKRLVGKLGTGALAVAAVLLCVWGLRGRCVVLLLCLASPLLGLTKGHREALTEDRQLLARTQSDMGEVREFWDELNALRRSYPEATDLEAVDQKRKDLLEQLRPRLNDLHSRQGVLLVIARRQMLVTSSRVIIEAIKRRDPLKDPTLAPSIDFHAEENKVSSFLKRVEDSLVDEDAEFRVMQARIESEATRRRMKLLGLAAAAVLAAVLCVWGFSGLRRPG